MFKNMQLIQKRLTRSAILQKGKIKLLSCILHKTPYATEENI